MKYAIRSAIPAILLFTSSACATQEHPRTVSDLCLVDKVIKVNPAPAAASPDPTNVYDSDITVLDVLQHNVVLTTLCESSARNQSRPTP